MCEEIRGDTKIKCLSEYLKAIETLKCCYPTQGIIENPTITHFLYRGISDEMYELLPALFRSPKDSNDPRNSKDSKTQNKIYTTFGTEYRILHTFMQEASGYISLAPSQLLQWAEYAQHYGAPTRFLDWSGNPLVALYFACREKKECNGNVWLLNVPNYSNFTTRKFPMVFFEQNMQIRDIVEGIINKEEKYCIFEYPILYTPYYVDARMSAQNSWFMVWGNNEQSLENMIGKRTHQMIYINNISDKLERTTTQEFWHRFLICSESKQQILRELDTVGINEKTLFPGMDGVGRYVEMKYHSD